MQNKNTIIIVVAVLAVVCLCALVAAVLFGGTIFAAVSGLTAPAAEQADAFMQALQHSDYASAYSLCTPALQQELGSPDALRMMIENGQVQPKSWKFTTRNVENDVATLEGSFVSSQAGRLKLELHKIGADWKVNMFNMEYGQ